MNNSLEQIADHLGYLGYITQPIESGDGRRHFLANHPADYNIFVQEFAPNVFLFRTSITHENKQCTAMDVAINSTNRVLNLSRVYYEIVDGKVVLRVEATHVGEYTKEAIGMFMLQFLRDIRSIPKVEEFERAFIDEPAMTESVLFIESPLCVIKSKPAKSKKSK